MLLIFIMALDTLRMVRTGRLSLLWQTILPEGWLESLSDRRFGWSILGAKLVRRYEVTIWFAVEGDTIYLPTADARRNWVRNVKARPDIELQIDGERFAGRAEELTDSGAIGHARALISAKYWYVMPLLYLSALLNNLGITTDRTAAFRMRPSVPQA